MLAASAQRTILEVLLAMLWVGFGMTVPSLLGSEVAETAAMILLTMVIGAIIVALVVEGYREGRG